MYSNSYNSTVYAGNNCWYNGEGTKPSIDTTGIYADPLFVNNDLTILGDYHVLDTSPCIDAGNNESAVYVGDQDLNGHKRTCNSVIDIGAFEKFVQEVCKFFLGDAVVKSMHLGDLTVQALYLGSIKIY